MKERYELMRNQNDYSHRYQFKSPDGNKSVRQFINLNGTHNIDGYEGVRMEIHVAQDQSKWNELQDSTTLLGDVYDPQLAKATNNRRGVDRTSVLSNDEWQELVEAGEIVEGESYEYLNRDSGQVEKGQNLYLAFESDVITTHMGAKPDIKTAKPMAIPLDIDLHTKLTDLKQNEHQPYYQAQIIKMRQDNPEFFGITPEKADNEKNIRIIEDDDLEL